MNQAASHEGIFWIEGSEGLALVLRPRGDHWLQEEVARLKRHGFDVLISMLEEDEAGWLGLRQEGIYAEKEELEFVSFPIPDHHVPPDPQAFRTFAADIAHRLAEGQKVAVHCQGSIGRATVTAACALVHRGWPPSEALRAIEAARGYEVPDTEEQRQWILAYRADA